MDWITLALKGLLGGCAAVGFSILFNVPNRTLIIIFAMGTIAILAKNLLMDFFLVGIVPSSFIAATIIGIIAFYSAKLKRTPPVVFSVPSVIPMVPGIFTYRFMLGIIELSGNNSENFIETFQKTTNNGLKAGFILMALAIGVSLPSIVLRKDALNKEIIQKEVKK